jgi:hypothetical protein
LQVLYQFLVTIAFLIQAALLRWLLPLLETNTLGTNYLSAPVAVFLTSCNFSLYAFDYAWSFQGLGVLPRFEWIESK